MSWHPALNGADPAAAWFTPSQLERIERDERQAAAYRHAMRRRELFEGRVAQAAGPLSPDALRALWDQADNEAKGDTK